MFGLAALNAAILIADGYGFPTSKYFSVVPVFPADMVTFPLLGTPVKFTLHCWVAVVGNVDGVRTKNPFPLVKSAVAGLITADHELACGLCSIKKASGVPVVISRIF